MMQDATMAATDTAFEVAVMAWKPGLSTAHAAVVVFLIPLAPERGPPLRRLPFCGATTPNLRTHAASPFRPPA
jgi:hypothetical protein